MSTGHWARCMMRSARLPTNRSYNAELPLAPITSNSTLRSAASMTILRTGCPAMTWVFRVVTMAMRFALKFPENTTVRQEMSPLILKDVFRLRAFVWRQLSEHPQFCSEDWTDEFDASALHWVALVDGRLAAAARMSVHDRLEGIPDFQFFAGLNLSLASPIASINRLVVHPDFRGMRLSHELDTQRLGAARKMNCRTMTVLESKLSGMERLRALERLGFNPVAPVYSLRDWDWVTPMVLSL
jgi:predicted GNAT family N-acyltransferase